LNKVGSIGSCLFFADSNHFLETIKMSYMSSASPSPLAKESLVRDLGMIVLGVILMTLAGRFARYPLPTPVPIPTTMLLALVPLLAIILGHFRANLIIGIYLLLTVMGVPVFLYHFPHHQLTVLLYWWPGAIVGFLLAVYVGGKVYEKRFNLSKFRLIACLFLVDVVLISPHFLWQWARVNEASIFVLVQIAASFLIQVALVLLVKATWWRSPAHGIGAVGLATQ
jgi:biotin transporter BioY